MSTEPISDAELDAILKKNRANGSVSMLRPMELYVHRDYLINLVRQSFATMTANRNPTAEDPKQQRAADRALQQRVDFIGWLTSQPDTIYMAIYPAQNDGITDDDVMDLLEDEDLWPFDP